MTVFLKNLDLSKLKTTKRVSTTKSTRVPAVPFPIKLYQMLEAVEADGNEHIVSWHPDGRTFQVHDPAKFVEDVLPNFFKQSKYKSFQRQVSKNGTFYIPVLLLVVVWL